MIVVFKKSTILCIIFTMILAIICGVFVGGKSSYAVSNNKYLIVVDAGHGGVDGGVTGVKTKVKESDLNLEISKKIAVSLQKENIGYILTRKTADGLYGLATHGFKRRDMLKRKEIIASSGCDLVISIHQNTYSDSRRRGVQIFYSDNHNKNTKKFADYMQEHLNNKINIPLTSRSYTAQNADLFIVKCSNVPSIVIECGFLSNAEDEKLLVNEEYQQKLSKDITEGVKGFLSKISEGNITENV